MKRFLVAFALLLAPQHLFAQTQPFDMTPERGLVDPATPAPVLQPEPGTTLPAATAPSIGTIRRNLIPSSQLVLSGETDSRAWSIWLTGEQALAPATLHLAYQNAIFVAPEASTLQLRINDSQVLSVPVRSPDNVSELEVEVPAGVLKQGDNTVQISASQRHRTDCTIEATYDLWTEIIPSGTYLSLQAPAARLNRLDDIAAIGVDEHGSTQFNLVVPALDQAALPTSIVRLAQTIALAANMPNQSFEISREPLSQPGPGNMSVRIGTASELSGSVPNLPVAAASSPFAGFLENPDGAESMLVVSGPNWQAIDTAISGLAAPLDRPLTVLRTAISTSRWRSPDAPMFREKGARTFADLGVATQEFSGRRFRTDFAFGIPADFFANNYGEATVLLDAAYAPEVLPGSHIDIYVNSNIAATVPITQAGGAILRHFPVDVTMRHFRPGPNIIAVEAVLMTEADRVCAPGATANDTRRFVLFDTSELRLPNFARIARRPDLAGLSGTGFPYGRAERPVSLLVADRQPETLSAASTLLARIAVAAGRQIPIASPSIAATAAEDTIFVGPASAIDVQALQQTGISDQIATFWATDRSRGGNADNQTNTEETFARWRNVLSGRGWRGSVSAFQDWLTRTFDFTVGSLKLFPTAAEPYLPGRDVRLVAAQQQSPAGEKTWAVFTAATPALLRDSTQRLTMQQTWSTLSGQMAVLNTANQLRVVRSGTPKFVPTQEFSIANYRLIAANWFSGNPLIYACGLFAACVLLGLATSGFLSGLGRRK
ncbi:MAG: cellulose biosynthesis cyclic di-GMP-binding regulatory protein BcsB [Rhizobiaceae bacterium]|nr:cellulose biosynthesis cyclic di-GMP-binding regulatory protein BcsB [Rhizobiaceae bacterium]